MSDNDLIIFFNNFLDLNKISNLKGNHTNTFGIMHWHMAPTMEQKEITAKSHIIFKQTKLAVALHYNNFLTQHTHNATICGCILKYPSHRDNNISEHNIYNSTKNKVQLKINF